MKPNIILRPAVYIYDHLNTFGREVDFIWNRPISIATILYALMHVCMLLYFALDLVIWLNLRCKVSQLEFYSSRSFPERSSLQRYTVYSGR